MEQVTKGLKQEFPEMQGFPQSNLFNTKMFYLFYGVSIPRNRELMRVYRDLELVEQLGSGVPRILESYGKECFHFMENFTRMTFPASEEVITQGRLVDGLVESQRKIVELINVSPKISKRDMSESIGISTTAIDKHIRNLREKNIIKRVGSDRAGHWELVKQE